MAIWGHDEVYVEKDVENRLWRVFTSNKEHQLLCTVNWADLFRKLDRRQYPDYLEALATCQSSKLTALTEEEEAIALAEARGEKPIRPTENVVEVDFARRRRR